MVFQLHVSDMFHLCCRDVTASLPQAYEACKCKVLSAISPRLDISLFSDLCASSNDTSYTWFPTVLASEDVNRNTLIMHVLSKTCHKFQTTTKMSLDLNNTEDRMVKRIQTRHSTYYKSDCKQSWICNRQKKVHFQICFNY